MIVIYSCAWTDSLGHPECFRTSLRKCNIIEGGLVVAAVKGVLLYSTKVSQPCSVKVPERSQISSRPNKTANECSGSRGFAVWSFLVTLL